MRNGLRWAAVTDTGRVRSANEDAFSATDRLFVVADGMGGHLAGEVASEMAVSTLIETLGPNRANRSAVDTGLVVAAVQRANDDILAASRASIDRSGMGTTITALAVVDTRPERRLALVNVGDSRAYVMRGGRLQQLSIDHSYVQELIETGQLGRDEARFHPQRNIVTRALGIEPHVRVDAWTLPIVTGDRFLLCSDGLVDEVGDETILELMDRIADPQTAANELVATANRHGGRDNVTVLIVDVLDGSPAGDPTLDLELEPHWADGTDEVAPWTDDATPTSPWGQPVDAAVSADNTPSNPGPVTESDTRDITRTMALPTIPPRGAPVDDRPVAPSSRAAAGSDAATSVSTTSDLDRAVSDSSGATTVAERRRAGWQPTESGNGLSWRTVVFLIALAGVVVAAFAAVAANARSGYYVTFKDDTVAIYKGKEGGTLWFDPTLSEAVGPVRAALDPAEVAAVEATPTFESLGEARVFVANLPTTTTAPSTTLPPTTTLAPVDTTLAPAPVEPPVAAPPPAEPSTTTSP
jgi:PPM family protein phosphatase